MKSTYLLSTILVCLFLQLHLNAQQNDAYKEIVGTEAAQIIPGAEKILLKNSNGITTFVTFENKSRPTEQKLFDLLHQSYKLPANYGFQLLTDEPDQIGMQHKRYQLTINNVPVSSSILILHLRNGMVEKFNGTLYKAVNTSTSPSLSEAQALQYALQNVGAKKYKWEIPGEEEAMKVGNPTATIQPIGKLEIVQPEGDANSMDFHLVWKFDIYAHEPIGRYWVFVDAKTGKIVNKINRICTAATPATAITVYRGSRPISTDSYNGSYRLRDLNRGNGVYTYNMHKGTSYAASTDFTNTTTTWNQVNANLDQYAGDAHWGGEMTYDFYTSMGRNSIDNAGFLLKLYVHLDVNYVNAYWDGSEMNFGDGNASQGYSPLTSLDVAGHEISHGLDEKTANLNYQNESGALNESFSDIFGTAVEWFADSTRANWLLGEDLGTPFRSLANPNLYGQPDTYHGTNWYTGGGDNGGVHTNSGVQNYWYYLLSQGGSGTNDIGSVWSVTGIGRTKATAIAWRTLTVYTHSTSQYADVRTFAIQAATDLYGACSPEVQATTQAWYAVGVGAAYSAGVHAAFTASQTTGCSVPFTVLFSNTSGNGGTYFWDFGDGTTSTVASPSHTYTTSGIYTVKLRASGGSCGTDSLIRTNYINVSTINPCVVILPTTGSYSTQTGCTGTIYDDGGASANYTDNADGRVTISPAGAIKVKLHFTAFNMEANYDSLVIYDGPSITSTRLAKFTGTTIPADITSTGPSITVREMTDGGLNYSGFAVTWTCIQANTPPVADFRADATQSCSGFIHFIDLTTGGDTAWLWNFGDGNTSTLQNPAHQYTANGTYTVTLKAYNAAGNNTMTKTAYITVNKPAGPVIANIQRCGPGSVTLNAGVTDSVTWFDAAGNIVATTASFTTPVLNSTTTYYAEQVIPNNTVYHLGPVDNTIGAGGYFISTVQRALRFNVNQPSTLQSVYVYAQAAGYRTVEYRDTLGNVFASKQFNLPVGASRITLNFPLLTGGPYELGVKDTQNLYRNTSGAVYPYTDAGGLVSITGNNIVPTTPSYYYFFYDWMVKGANCVSQRTPVTITIGSGMTVTATPTNITCNGAGNGSISTSITGGTSPYTYSWSPIGTGANPSSLGVGTYTVTVTATGGCTATASASITQPSALSATASSVAANCSSNTGSVSVVATGGTTNYTYHWAGGQTTSTVNNLAPGTYSVTVTDAHNCTTTASTTVTSTGSLTLTPSQVNVRCNGGATGSASIVAAGTSPYQYHWSNNTTASNITNIVAGVYTVTVNDGAGCSALSSFTITQPNAIGVTLTPLSANCGTPTGAIAGVVTGGTSNYTYHWATGQSTLNLSNVLAGPYALTVTDANSCTATANTTVGSVGSLSTSISNTNENCNGGNNATATVTASGATPYAYHWSTNSTNATVNNLVAGTYTVTVSDATGCSAITSVTVTEPAVLAVSLTANDAHCGLQNGSVVANVTGGTTNYTYAWSNSSSGSSISGLSAGGYGVVVTDNHNCTASANATVGTSASLSLTDSLKNISCHGNNDGTLSVNGASGTAPYTYHWATGPTSPNLTGLSQGIYTVTVTDAGGCSVISTFTITEPALLSIALTTGNATCGQQNGNVAAVPSGGTGSYTYQWSNAGGSTSSISNVPSGPYALTVTDGNNCTATASTSVTGTNALTLTNASQDISCNGAGNGVAEVSINGGTAPFGYHWSTGATSVTLPSVGAGTYSVTVTDASSCTSTYTITVTEPSALSVTPTTVTPLCYGLQTGSIQLAVSGGTQGYSYAWNVGGTGASLSNLSAGNYIATVTDGNNCHTVQTVTVTQPDSLQMEFNETDVTCFGDNNGTAYVKVIGGTPTYSLTWSNGGTDTTLNSLPAGTYILTITDVNGCQKTGQVDVTQPASALAVAVTHVNTVQGQNIGSATLNVTGGTSPYSVAWSNTYTGTSISGLAAGVYSYTVSDANGCTDTGSIEISGGVGIAELASGINAEIFPNPTAGQVNIVLHIATNGDRVAIQLNDVLGRSLSHTDLDAAKEMKTSLNLTNYPSGIYFIEITCGEHKLVHKVILDK